MGYFSEHLEDSISLGIDIACNTALLRHHALTYVKEHDPKDLNAFITTNNLVMERIGAAIKNVSTPEHLSHLKTVQEAVAQYGSVFENIVQLIQKKQNIIMEDLNHYKYLVEDGLSGLKVFLMSSKDANSLLFLESAAKNFLEMQLNGWRFIQTGEEKYFVVLRPFGKSAPWGGAEPEGGAGAGSGKEIGVDARR